MFTELQLSNFYQSPAKSWEKKEAIYINQLPDGRF